LAYREYPPRAFAGLFYLKKRVYALIMNIEKNIALNKHTTFHIGGPARYFTRVSNVKELKEAVLFAKENGVPFFTLGNGSNILVSDSGYEGLAIKMELKGISFDVRHNDFVRAISFAGELWDDLVKKTVEKNISGLENLSLIPSSVGASPVQNIGAYGVEVKDTLAWVEAFNSETLLTEVFSPVECGFGYRESFFKTPEGKKYIVTRVAFDLKKNGPIKTDYKDVQEYFSELKIKEPTQKDVRDAIVEIRTRKMPDLFLLGTAGSFFKNPVVSRDKAEEIKAKYPDAPIYFPAGNSVKIHAAYLLDKVCGLKGYREGNVGTWENQALVIVNHGNASAKEITEFALMMQNAVLEKIGVELEFEVQLIK